MGAKSRRWSWLVSAILLVLSLGSALSQTPVVVEPNPTSLICALEFPALSGGGSMFFTFQANLASRGIMRPLMAWKLSGMVTYPDGSTSVLSLLPSDSFADNDNTINWPSVIYKRLPVGLTSGGLGVTFSNGHIATLFFNAVEYTFVTSDTSVNAKFLPAMITGQCSYIFTQSPPPPKSSPPPPPPPPPATRMRDGCCRATSRCTPVL
mmetsp:Transcript_16972/g.36702  ORF Transcript_16972/g.36702 Transcript_16972/m.36702 type:complete len:208 (+) Transcript_16972:80-703(+)